MGESIEFYVAVILGAMVLSYAIHFFVTAPARILQKKFVELGQLKGKTKDQIVSVVGPPNSVSVAPGGKTLCQWITTGYHIALLFNEETCEGVSHEFAHR